MSLWTAFDEGMILPEANTLRQRLSLRLGRWFACRHQNVSIGDGCRIHPGAMINPRNGIIQLGNDCSIARGAAVQGNVKFGDHCSLQMYSIVVGYGSINDPKGQVSIGSHVRIASHVMIIAANHRFDDVGATIHGQGLEMKPINIEDDVWIGGGVFVSAGVTIGRGSVIGAGSVVTKSIPPGSVAVGVPARRVRARGEADEDGVV